jgi:hypothetical protein
VGQGGAGLCEGMGSGSEASLSRGVLALGIDGVPGERRLLHSVTCLAYPCPKIPSGKVRAAVREA